MTRFAVLSFMVVVWLCCCPHAAPAAEEEGLEQIAERLMKRFAAEKEATTVSTELGQKGEVERWIGHDLDDVPVAVRAPKLWKEIARPRPGKGERAIFRASGRFASVKDVPDHLVVRGPAGTESRLVREYRRRDLVLVTEHHWRETLTSGLTRKGMQQARAELAELLVPLAEEIFQERWGKEYDATALFKAVRAGAKGWAAEALDQWHDEIKATMKIEDGLDRVAAAWRRGLIRRGLACPRDADALAVLFDRAHALIRRKDATPGPFLVEQIMEPETMAAARRVVVRRFGSVAAFEKKALPSLERLFGPYAVEGRLVRGLHFSLTIPGAVVETNGEPPPPSRGMCCAPGRRGRRPALDEWTVLHWRFVGLETNPAGKTMEARSLLGHEELQEKLFGEARLDTPEKAREYVDLVSASEPLLAALRACRKVGKAEPLHQHRRAALARGDRVEVARVDRLLRLVLPGKSRKR
jgi:hypothetical protein